MRQSFIHQSIDLIVQKSSEEKVIVLPSKRAAVSFIKQYKLKSKLGQFLPQVYSIEEFISKLSNLNLLSKLELQLEFFKVVNDLKSESQIDFIEFSNWADGALADFSEIDAYKIDTTAFYKSLTDLKALDSWMPLNQEFTNKQKNYFRFWDDLATYHHHLKKSLLQKNVAYNSLAFRKVAENCKDLFHQADGKWLNNAEIFFVGFNAINNCELTIFNWLKSENRLHLIYDVDDYYYQDSNQEAGYFIRKWVGQFKDHSDVIKSNLRESIESIEIKACQENVGQIKSLAKDLTKLNPQEKAAIVLADEKVLPILLESIPENINELNISIGYNIQNASLLGSVKDLLNLYIDANAANKGYIKAKIVADVLNLSFVSISGDPIELKSRVLWTEQELIDAIDSLIWKHTIEFLFSNENQFLDHFKILLDHIVNHTSDSENKIEFEVALSILNSLNKLKELITKYQLVLSAKEFYHVFQTIVAKDRIDFLGSKSAGVQIMGILESRLLDFDHVFLIGLNEGSLPKSANALSFIPNELRIQFELPNHFEKTAVFAYHFYRLIQRAKSVNLYFNNVIGDGGVSDPSRYILQLESEFHDKGGKAIMRQGASVMPIVLEEVENTDKIAKNDWVNSKILKYLERGVSPSAINVFFSDSLEFYIQYLARIKKADIEQLSLEVNNLGDIAHYALEEYYRPFVNSVLSTKLLSYSLEKIEKLCTRAFHEKFQDFTTGGINLLALYAIMEMVKKTIDFDIKRIKAGNKIELLSLEQTYERVLNIGGVDVNFKGNIDRVERCNGIIQVIDYKSGNVTSVDVKYKEPEDLIIDKKGKARQLLMYAWLLKGHFNDHLFYVGNLSLRNLQQGILWVNKDEVAEVTESSLQDFEKFVLQEFVQQLLDDDFDFQRNEDYRYSLV